MAFVSNGTTILDAGAFSASLGSMTLIKTITLSSAAGTVSFVHGASDVVLDSTYPMIIDMTKKKIKNIAIRISDYESFENVKKMIKRYKKESK